MAGGGNLFHGLLQLRSAIAAARAEHVAGEAFAVHAYECAAARVHAAPDEREMVLIIDGGAVQMQIEFAEVGGHGDEFLAGNEFFTFAAVLDELGNAADF